MDSILKNFRNPWEDENWVLQTDVLDTSVLDNNVLKSQPNLDNMNQTIIPTAYLFTTDEGLSASEVKRVRNEVILI
jgi:hypothetical protein